MRIAVEYTGGRGVSYAGLTIQGVRSLLVKMSGLEHKYKTVNRKSISFMTRRTRLPTYKHMSRQYYGVV